VPTYDYLCENCGHKFEEFQSMSQKPLRKCPDCGKLQLKRLIGTGAGIIFKGSGFYETDYRSQDYKEAQKNDKPTAPDDKTKKKDTTPDKPAASDTKPKPPPPK